MQTSRLNCVSSLCSGHATVLNRWSRNRKLSQIQKKKMSLDNFSNSGSKFPNSFVPEKNELEKKNKLRGSEVLKISNVQVQTHFLLKTMDTKKKTQRLRLSPVWVQKVVRVSREQNFATRKQLYSWESSREGEFSNLCCQNLQAYMWPARLYCCCFCK